MSEKGGSQIYANCARADHFRKSFSEYFSEYLFGMTVFDQRKRRILEDLQSDEPDLSPKGRPDDEILKLLELINSNDDYVSTSSCSGRAVVFLDGDNNGQGEEAQGRWLMTRHKQFGEELLTWTVEQLYTTLFGSLKIGAGWSSFIRPPRLITLKFEPLVHSYSV